MAVQNNSSCKSSGMKKEHPPGMLLWKADKSSNRTVWETWEEGGGSVLLVWDA